MYIKLIHVTHYSVYLWGNKEVNESGGWEIKANKTRDGACADQGENMR